jgi:hypothetical protein
MAAETIPKAAPAAVWRDFLRAGAHVLTYAPVLEDHAHTI